MNPTTIPAALVAQVALMTLGEAHALLPGATLHGDPGLPFCRVHSDTRSLRPGDLFVALRGERFDAHDFLPQARAAGAVAALAESGIEAAGLPGLVVPDALAALQQLAAGWRARFQLPLAAVTGSNGKTTVTQMVGAMLRAWQGEAALVTAGNLNNHIGLPLTLLRLRPAHRCAVVELGMNHPGEICLLAGLAAPTVGLVINAQREHQEFMASVDAVALENGAVIEALPADGVAVFPAASPYTALWTRLAGARPCLRFALHNDDSAALGSGHAVDGAGETSDAGAADAGAADASAVGAGVSDVRGSARWSDGAWSLALATPAGSANASLALPGRHNAVNALAATACALALGAPLSAVVAGLAGFEAVQGRTRLLALTRRGRALTLVDDSYNANPDSVRAAIDLLAGLPGPRWLLLGDMAEVGDQGPAFHAEVGVHARERGVEQLWCVGPAAAAAAAAFGTGARHFADLPSLVAGLGGAPLVASLLVKGSRSMGMERVVQALQEAGDAA